MLGRETGLGKMMGGVGNFKEIDLRFLETRREDQEVREQIRTGATNH